MLYQIEHKELEDWPGVGMRRVWSGGHGDQYGYDGEEDD